MMPINTMGYRKKKTHRGSEDDESTSNTNTPRPKFIQRFHSENIFFGMRMCIVIDSFLTNERSRGEISNRSFLYCAGKRTFLESSSLAEDRREEALNLPENPMV
jgi:hypothetical protein